MNPQEQRERATAITRLEQIIGNRLDDLVRKQAVDIDTERANRLALHDNVNALAREQRAYVDHVDFMIQRSLKFLQEAQVEHIIIRSSFWRRMRHLFTGWVPPVVR